MAELITEEQPRIKYSTRFVGHLHLLPTSAPAAAPAADPSPSPCAGPGPSGGQAGGPGADAAGGTVGAPALAPLVHLSRLMARMESLGAAPILNDGQVAGNCAISPALLAAAPSAFASADAPAAVSASAGTSADAAGTSASAIAGGGAAAAAAAAAGAVAAETGGVQAGERSLHTPAGDATASAAAGGTADGAKGDDTGRGDGGEVKAGAAASSPAAATTHGTAPPPATPLQPLASSSPQPLQGLALVSMSGKPPGHVLDPAADFVLVTEFDRTSWAASYRSRDPRVRPSSDSPLLVAALARGREYGWDEVPYVVLHGHALAEGEGLSYAAQLGLPISPRATLFSTPEDLAELEGLFRAHPYPDHACYIRRGHGFFLLGRSVGEAEELFDRLIVPWLDQQQREGQRGREREMEQQQQRRE